VKKSFAQILSGIDDRQARKLETKLPEWASAEGIEIPSSLALEQCSSTATALYKAALIGKTGIITDITGGLGVDCRAFSGIADKVFYFEQNQELAEAARKNFDTFGIGNVTVTNATVTKDSPIPDCDLIFADPARRSGTGRKVFLLEDCTPDVLSMMDLFWRHTPRILLKLSPMADITMLASRLGERLKEIHIVSLDGECKELLCILDKAHTGGFTITVADLGKNSGQRSNPDSKIDTLLKSTSSLSFTPEDERQSAVRYTRGISNGQYLFEPSAALMKSGCFKLISDSFGMEKLSKDTHLYITGSIPEELRGLGKFFLIEEVRRLDKAAMKEMGKANPRAEVSARGIPMRSEELRDRLGCKSGGSRHIFGCSAQVALPEGVVAVERMLLLCSPVSVHPVGVDHQVELHLPLL